MTTRERNRKIFIDRIHGRSYMNIANSVELSKTRVAQIAHREARLLLGIETRYKEISACKATTVAHERFKVQGPFENDLSVKILDLPNRVHQALCNAKIEKIWQLQAMTKQEFFRCGKHMGIVSLLATAEELERCGFPHRLRSDPK